MKSKIVYISFFLCFMCCKAWAQNNTSPYSILGIGDIESGYHGRWSGMANTSVALSSNRYLNQANVASLSQLDDQFFVFEVSGRYKYTNYINTSSTALDVHSADLTMRKLALGIKVTKKWGSGIAFNPYSSSNYSFYSKKTIQGTNYQTDVYNEGNGGLNQVYWANSYTIIKNVSLGVQTGFLFGSLNQQESLSTAVSTTPILTTRNIYLRSPFINYAFQYKGKVGKKWQVGLGATYAGQKSLNAEYSVKVTDNDVAIVDEEVIKNDNYQIPKTYTAGAALTYDKKFTIASDIRNQDWSTLNYKGYNYRLVNSTKYSAGFEYSKKISAFGISLENAFYQAGFFYNKSYLQLYDQQLKDYGFTLGIGANSKRNSLGYHVALEIGSRGTTNKGLIKENYSQVTFTLSYRDLWYTKGRKYD
jgi:hypothetical protein